MKLCKFTLHPDHRSRLVVPANSSLYRQLISLATHYRMIFLAGLPGTGKSLLIHQLAHLAGAHNRHLHLMQYDVIRPVFESHPVARPYPLKNGVTHGVIRLAIGVWIRQAVRKWHLDHSGREHLLIGETPFVGNRLIELAQSWNDATEPLLCNTACVFVIPVPDPKVRRFIEAERARRGVNPVHEREREDAPPHVLQQLWQELTRIAQVLGIVRSDSSADIPYQPMLYRQVYEALLRHRHTRVMSIDTLLATPGVSAYDFSIQHDDLTPTPRAVIDAIHHIEQKYPDPESLQQRLQQWYLV